MKRIKIKSYSKKIIADTITPVEVYLKIRDKYPNSILLESSDYMQSANNYSFICFNQIGFFELKNHLINLQYPGEKSNEIQLTNRSISEYLNDYIKGYDVEKTETQFISNGLFGYMSHESVKYQENIEFSEEKDDLDIPDIFYGFYQNIIAISLFNHEAHIYCNSFNGENNIEEVEDIINAVKIILNDKSKPGSYLIKNNKNYSISEIINKINKDLSKKIKVIWLSKKVIKEKIYKQPKLKNWYPKKSGLEDLLTIITK